MRVSRSVRRSGLFSAALSLILVSSLWGQTDFDQEIRDHQAQLEAMRQEAESKRLRARQFGAQEKGVLAGLRQTEEALTATRRYVERLESRMASVQDDIRKTLVDLSWAEGELQERQGELSRRLRHSYMHSKVRSLEIIFSAESFPSLLQRSAFLSRVLDQDRRLVEAVTERQNEVQQKLESLEGQRTELDYLQGEKREEERQIESLMKEQEAELARVKNQKATNQKAAEDLERAATQLQTVMAELERKRQDAVRRNNRMLTELDRLEFGNNRGRLPWPTEGKVITGFGRQQHAKYKTVTISNGIDISAPAGTPVRSVGDGVVDLVNWLPGYGETVILNHGKGFYSIYGHLSSIAVVPGDRLNPGDLLGTVGDTGSLKGTCLHFELRQGGNALDPQAWLR